MNTPRAIPSGSELDSQRDSKRPLSAPQFPETWTSTALLAPFGDSISPLSNYAQLIVGILECSCSTTESWMRALLFLTQDKKYFDFIFTTATSSQGEQSSWYWIDSAPDGQISNIYGPFATTLRIPTSMFLSEMGARWGNSYPLMCTNSHPTGVSCDHWVLPSPGATDHGSWYSFRKEDSRLFRIFSMDANNPLMIP